MNISCLSRNVCVNFEWLSNQKQRHEIFAEYCLACATPYYFQLDCPNQMCTARYILPFLHNFSRLQ